MEKINFTEEEINNFKVTYDKLNKLSMQLADNISKILNPLLDNISTWLNEPVFTKKRFIQLLHELGYSYKEARKIAYKYPEQEGKYTLAYYLTEKTKKEELDSVAKH